MSETPKEVFVFCDGASRRRRTLDVSKKHPGKRIPVVRLVKTAGGWMERGPAGVLFRPGVEFVTSNGLRGRFSARPGHSPFFRCPRCGVTVPAGDEKLGKALDEAAADNDGVSEISLRELSLKLQAVGN